MQKLCGAICVVQRRSNVRMLINEARRVVDLVVDHNEEILLGVVLRDVGVGEFLVGHGIGVWTRDEFSGRLGQGDWPVVLRREM